MSTFEPELFGFGASQYQELSKLFFLPTISFGFLYLLGLPLKKLPFLIDDSGFEPPGWVLPTFFLSGLVVMLSSFSAYATLLTVQDQPDVADFQSQYQRQYEMAQGGEKIEKVGVSVEDYDGLSNLRVFVNGYRVFGTSADCLLRYQCKTSDDEAARNIQEDVKKHAPIDNSIYHLYAFSTLPHQIDVSDYTVSGYNYVDIHSENSGYADCRFDVKVNFLLSNGTLVEKEFNQSTTVGGEPVQSSFDGVDKLQFFAPDEQHNPESLELLPFRTLAHESTNRLCERIRVRFKLQRSDTSANDLVLWASRMRERLRIERCQDINYDKKRPYCDGVNKWFD